MNFLPALIDSSSICLAISVPNNFVALNLEMESGRLLYENDRRKVILGNDFLSEDYGKQLKVGKKVIIQREEFEIIGFLKKSGTFTLNNVILMPDKDLRKILNIGDEFDILVVQLKNKDELKEIKKIIENKIREDRNQKLGEEDFSIQTPEQTIQTINSILNTINLVIAGIAAISLLVGGIGITNTMYTSVLERKKEIGILKSVGAKNSDILIIFSLESGLLGLIGGLIGIIIGILFSKTLEFIAINYLSASILKLVMPYYLILGLLLFSFLVGVFSGFLPSWQATKVNPVEALRYE